MSNKMILDKNENFIKRMPKINIYQEQLKHLDPQILQYYKIFLIHKLKFIKGESKIKEWVSKADFKQNEEQFFKQLRYFVNPPKVIQQYQRTLEIDIKRGLKRVKQFQRLFKSIPSLKDIKLENGADDACGTGVISKVFAQSFGLKRMDLFEPYVPETKYEIKGIKFQFYNIPFEKRKDKKTKYDCFSLQAALHHIPNPIEVIKSIKQSLKPGGLLFVREHLPIPYKQDQYKQLLDLQEKSWAYSLSLEYQDGMKEIKQKTYPPQSYFYENELYELIDMKLLGKLKEDNYIQNEFMNYFIFQMPK